MTKHGVPVVVLAKILLVIATRIQYSHVPISFASCIPCELFFVILTVSFVLDAVLVQVYVGTGRASVNTSHNISGKICGRGEAWGRVFSFVAAFHEGIPIT